MQESDNLKAKRIMNLEAQLNEARKTVCQVNDLAKDNHDKTSNENQTENIKITNLELKTNSLEQQVTILFSKLETINHAKEAPKVPGKLFPCDLCEAEFQEKVNIKKQKELSHGALYKCDDCPFTTVSPTSLDSHKKTHRQQFLCPSCEFKTENETYLNKHKTKHDMKCDQCSYHAINHKDLRRHTNAMHPQIIPCDLCPYEATNKNELQGHRNEEHIEETFISCNLCEYLAQNHDDLQNHIFYDHTQKTLTRIFSARRPSSSSSNQGKKPQASKEEVFRPWSSSSRTCTRPYPSPSPTTSGSSHATNSSSLGVF